MLPSSARLLDRLCHSSSASFAALNCMHFIDQDSDVRAFEEAPHSFHEVCRTISPTRYITKLLQHGLA